MKVEIQSISNDPACTLLDVYKVPATRPSYRIYQEDLYEIMTDAQIKAWENGKYVLDLKQADLFDKCKNFWPYN